MFTRLACAAVAMLVGGASAKIMQVDPTSHNHAAELHHSLRPSQSKSQVYWNFGGATVLTKDFMRLTSSTQDRMGWLWNEYPLESENWEVEFKLQLHSKPHFGGDGMAFWVLHGDMDPTFEAEPDFLNGPTFGLKSDYRGFGVAFDVYDNDSKRNNPSVFVLQNGGKQTSYNHDNDYENDMVRSVPSVIPGHEGSEQLYKSHKCVADIRNTGRDATVLVKYLHQVLHVYIDTNEGAGWKFCLAVELNESYLDHHVAFTAATGQVADNHDLMEVTTRYLADSDKEVDDTAMAHFGNGGSEPSGFFWCFIALAGAALVGGAVFELVTLRNLLAGGIDSVRAADTLNAFVKPHIGLHAFVSVLTLIGGTWTSVLLNAPLMGWRAYEFASGNAEYTSQKIVQATHKSGTGMGAHTKLVVLAAGCGVLELVYLYMFIISS